ncbi:MAG TPA: hypothetical protein VIH96_03760, partial [Paraburkholderia sp.]
AALRALRRRFSLGRRLHERAARLTLTALPDSLAQRRRWCVSVGRPHRATRRRRECGRASRASDGLLVCIRSFALLHLTVFNKFTFKLRLKQNAFITEFTRDYYGLQSGCMQMFKAGRTLTRGPLRGADPGKQRNAGT